MVDNQFILALAEESIYKIRKLEKGDLHNHISRGGNILKYRKIFNMPPLKKPLQFNGYSGMESWYKDNIRKYFDNSDYNTRIMLGLQQLNDDGITLGVLTYGIAELKLFDSIEQFIEKQNELYKKYAPNANIIPELGINTNSNLEDIERNIDHILKFQFFRSIDIHGKEMTQPRLYKKIYSRAYSYGLRLRAHIGEFGLAEMIKIALRELELNEINHGNSAVTDKYVIKEILKRKVRINMCPYSNIFMGQYNNLREHPIKTLYNYGITITVNSDDMLIFDKSVSDIFLDLYKHNIFTAEQLNEIRKNALVF